MSSRDTYLTQTGEEVQALLDAVPNKADIFSGTTSYWNSRSGYIPKAKEVIVYTDYKTVTRSGQTVQVPGVKIGSGNGYVQDLAFIDEAAASSLLAHAENNSVHVTAVEKALWNNKLNVSDSAEVVNEALVFNRN